MRNEALSWSPLFGCGSSFFPLAEKVSRSELLQVDPPEFEAGGLRDSGTPYLPPPQRVGRRGLRVSLEAKRGCRPQISVLPHHQGRRAGEAVEEAEGARGGERRCGAAGLRAAMRGRRPPAFLAGSSGRPFGWRPFGPPAQTRSVEGEALRITPKFRPADQTIEMFLAEIAGRGRSSAGRRGAGGRCLGGGLRGVSIDCGRLARQGRLRHSLWPRGLRGEARRLRQRRGIGLLMRAGGGSGLGVETWSWSRRSRGEAGRRFPRAPGRRAVAGR